VSWHRGLFATSPLFLLAFPGLVAMWRRGLRRLALLIGAAFAYYMLFVSSTAIWYAGWGFGPRLMVPVLGWVALAVGFGVAGLRAGWARGLALGLGLWGILYAQAVNAVFPELPERFVRPLTDIVLPALREGVLVPNLTTRLIGLRGLPSLIPLVIVLGVLLVFLVRSFARDVSGKARLALGLAGTGVLAVMLLLARVAAPAVVLDSTANHLRWMHELLADEAALWKAK
jgi:hypothetical protein